MIAGRWTMPFVTHYQSGDPLSVTDTNGTPIPIAEPQTSGGVEDRLGDRLDRRPPCR